MLVGLTILFGGLFIFLSASITELTSRLGFYAKRLNGRVGDIQDLIDRLGLSDVNLSDAISGSAVVGALGTVLSGLAGFLSSLFLVLFIVLFLLSEGSAISTGKPGDGSAAPVRALPGYCEERLPICSRMPVPWPTSMR